MQKDTKFLAYIKSKYYICNEKQDEFVAGNSRVQIPNRSRTDSCNFSATVGVSSKTGDLSSVFLHSAKVTLSFKKISLIRTKYEILIVTLPQGIRYNDL